MTNPCRVDFARNEVYEKKGDILSAQAQIREWKISMCNFEVWREVRRLERERRHEREEKEEEEEEKTNLREEEEHQKDERREALLDAF